MRRFRCTWLSPVHPRLRGELRETSLSGLPRARFIPAYAGNSYDSIIEAVMDAVHPRLRGELQNLINRSSDVFGSSPLTRGTRSGVLEPPGLTAVHPRLRGELSATDQHAQEHPGSSPLTRGTQKKPRPSERTRRFIPAYAGNSSSFYRALPS